MRQVVVGVVLVLDISLNGTVSGSCRTGSHNGGIHATCLLPVDEIGHRVDETVVTDNQKVALFVHGGVFGRASLIVEEMAMIDVLEVGIHLHHLGTASIQSVLAVVIHLVHLDGQVVIHTESLRDGIVDKRMHCDVLSAEVAEDIRCVQLSIAGREEGVLAVAFAVGVRHSSRVDSAGEVALRGCHLDVFKIPILGIDNSHTHLRLIANHDRDANHGHIRLAGLGSAHRIGHRDDVSLSSRSVHSGGVETRYLNMDLNAFLG